MPWTKRNVKKFNKSISSDKEKERWVNIANSVLRRCLEKGGSQKKCEASAIRQANGALKDKK